MDLHEPCEVKWGAQLLSKSLMTTFSEAKDSKRF